MNIRIPASILLTLSATLLPAPCPRAAAPGEQPDTSAICPYPQQINTTTLVNANASMSNPNPVVFNGADFATIAPVYYDYNRMHFRRIFADGSFAGSDVTVASAYPVANYSPVAMVWTGSNYGIAWETNETPTRVLFALLDINGTMISGPTPLLSYASRPSLAWNAAAGQFAAVYEYNLSVSDIDVYASLINAAGTVTYSAFIISSPVNFQVTPVVTAFSSYYYDVTWSDNYNTPASVYALRTASLSTTGTVGSISYAVPPSSYYQNFPTIAASQYGVGLAYIDNSDIYFTRKNGGGGNFSPPVRVTFGGTIYSAYPQLSYNGTEYALLWDAYVGSTREAFMQRVNPGGTLAGSPVQLTNSVSTSYPSVAFGRHGYLMHAETAYDETVTPIGCNYDSTPPVCAGNYMAYNIAPTSATLAWLPGDDPETDIAYYQIYQNDAPLAKTSASTYNLTGLTNGATYNYAIRPVNAAALINASCTASLYLKSGVGPTLTMTKGAVNARLDWTSLGWNSYNVFRGTDPRLQNLLVSVNGLTTSDPVLSDGASYFYTVDDPGQ